MLRRSFLKGVGALFAVAAVPAFALKDNSIAIPAPNIPGKGYVAIRVKGNWFVVPVHYMQWPQGERIHMGAESIMFQCDAAVDLRNMKYIKSREGHLRSDLLLVDRLAIANAPVLTYENRIEELNKVLPFKVREIRGMRENVVAIKAIEGCYV